MLHHSKEEYHRFDEERQTDSSRFQPQGDYICHIAILADFTSGALHEAASGSTSSLAEATTAGAFLGIHHWNTRNSSVVKELDDIDWDTCKLQFTSEVLDGQTQRSKAIQQVTRLVLRHDTTRPCAILSALEDDVTTTDTAAIASAQHMIYASTSTTVEELDNRQAYPSFVRMNASIRGSARSALHYLSEKKGIQYFGIAYPETQEGLSVRNLLVDAARSYNMSALLFPVPVSFASSSSSDFIQEETKKKFDLLLTTKLNYTISYIPIQQYNALQEWLPIEDVVESSLMKWILVEPDELPSSRSDIRSARHFLFREESYLARPNDDEAEDIFQHIWEEDLEWWDYTNVKLESWMTKSRTKQGNGVGISRDREVARLGYDTIVGMGLAACRTMKQNGPNNFFGIRHSELVNPNESFLGASGKIQFGVDMNSRKEENSYYAISEILQENEHIQSYYQPSKGTWFSYSTHEEIPNGSLQSFHQNLNLISNATRFTCLFMSLIALISSLGCFMYTVVKWKHPIIKSSQPPFLIMICCGTILMSSSIIPMTMDDSTTLYVDLSCSLQIWLFFSGFVITFSALFSKLWRVNKVSFSFLLCVSPKFL